MSLLKRLRKQNMEEAIPMASQYVEVSNGDVAAKMAMAGSLLKQLRSKRDCLHNEEHVPLVHNYAVDACGGGSLLKRFQRQLTEVAVKSSAGSQKQHKTGGSLLKQMRSAQGILQVEENVPIVQTISEEADNRGGSLLQLIKRGKVQIHLMSGETVLQKDETQSSGRSKRKYGENIEAYRPAMVQVHRRFRESYRSDKKPVSDSGSCGSTSASSSLDCEQEAKLAELLRDSAPDSTLTQDNSHVRTWTAACKIVGMHPWRLKSLRSSKQRRKEMRKLAYATWVVHLNMKPRCKKDVAAKPDSAYQVYLGMRREHERRGYQMADGKFVLMAMKSMNKRFIKKWGYQALITKRKEPLTRRMIEGFLSIKEGTRLGCVKVDAKSRGYKSWRCLNATSAQTGLRKDEVSCKTKKEGLSKVQFTRESLVFAIHGEDYPDPDARLLNLMDDTCGVKLKPRPSKADQKGAFWCDKPIYLPYRANDPVCAAREFVEQELLYPVRGLKRAKVPLFADDKGQPFSKSQVTSAFLAMLKLVVPATDVKKYSFHGYRIYLACALDAVNCPPEKIKRILRWVSDEALRTYVRDGNQMYIKWLDSSSSAVINTVQVANLPSLEGMKLLADCPEEDDAYDSEDD